MVWLKRVTPFFLIYSTDFLRQRLRESNRPLNQQKTLFYRRLHHATMRVHHLHLYAQDSIIGLWENRRGNR